MFQMTDSQSTTATLVPKDAKGSPVPIPDGDAVVWASSDPSVFTVTAAPDGLTAAVQAVAAGQAQINVTVNDASGNPIASGNVQIQVTPGALASIAINLAPPA